MRKKKKKLNSLTFLLGASRFRKSIIIFSKLIKKKLSHEQRFEFNLKKESHILEYKINILM